MGGINIFFALPDSQKWICTFALKLHCFSYWFFFSFHNESFETMKSPLYTSTPFSKNEKLWIKSILIVFVSPWNVFSSYKQKLSLNPDANVLKGIHVFFRRFAAFLWQTFGLVWIGLAWFGGSGGLRRDWALSTLVSKIVKRFFINLVGEAIKKVFS